MSHSHRHERSVTPNSATPVTKQASATGGSEKNISETIPASSTDLLVAWTCDITALVALFIASDQDLLIETNESASGDAADILNLVANKAIDWMEDDVMDHPFSEDVTVLYVTNSGDDDAQLEIRALEDATP